MTTSTRRIVAVGAAAFLGVAVLAGCSSSSGTESASASASEAASDSAQMLPPVIINVDETTATAKVGDFIDILVSDNDIAATMVATDRPDLVELTQASEEEGGAAFNPGGKALAPGVAIITVTNPDGTTRDITLTITE